MTYTSLMSTITTTMMDLFTSSVVMNMDIMLTNYIRVDVAMTITTTFLSTLLSIIFDH